MKINVIEYLTETTLLFPNKVAVKDATGEISFSQLFETGKKIATHLMNMRISGKPVCVFMSKNKEAIISFLGINYSGNFYVPLDTKSPISRLNSILQVINSEVVITDKLHYGQLKEFYNKQVIVFEEILEHQKIDEFSLDIDLNNAIDTDPIYAIFTSGSTGTPKGVVISHRSVIDYIDWAIEKFDINETAIIGNQAPFYFDNSTLDIYLMSAVGATLVIIPDELFIFPPKLIDYLNFNKINLIFWVPFVLINLANSNIFSSKKPEYLRDVFFAGEVMPNKHLNYWRNYLPDCRYVNLYGPTEITVDCTYYIVERAFTDNEPLPIGFPCKNTAILILSENKRLVKKHEQGELCVRGTSLALGYYNDIEKTKNSFIQNPLNDHYPELIYCTGDLVYINEFDEIIFIGRKHSQIKHNGFRIELGEIETAALGTNLINTCCVVYDWKNKQINLFYVAEEDLNIADFRKVMSILIPKYMLPSKLIRMDELPINSNGKIDRLRLNKKLNE